MALAQYIKKRKFENTPEPAPGKTRKSKSLTFVVQRHEARRLHYDFRLELDGALKSWAVPKGPSMKAGEKRLAVLVEDHPLDYGKFYGFIPEGNYGAGKVEIWDQGTYKPLETIKTSPEALIKAGFKKGDLKFTLKGQYLKGAFALVRINDETGKNWLLIKKKDDFAFDKFDIETISPLKSPKQTKAPINKETPKSRTSLKSTSRTKSTIRKEKKIPAQTWNSINKPMLATLAGKVINDTTWIYEMKYDGYRAITKIEYGIVEMISRNGNSFNKIYSQPVKVLEKVAEVVVIDGELVIENSKGRSDFQLMQNYSTSKKGKLKYYVFDMLYLNGYVLTKLPLFQRKELLSSFFDKYPMEHIHLAEYVWEKGEQLFEKLSSKGHEGIIAKNSESIYLPGKRSDNWLKIKSVQSHEAIICGYTLPQNSRKHIGSLVLGIYDNDILTYIGNCGTGFTDAALKDLHKQFESLETPDSPFKNKIQMTGVKGKVVWLKPRLVCEVKFLAWTAGLRLRNPVFVGLRKDKKPKEITKEIKMKPNSTPSSKTTGNDLNIKIGKNNVKITNPGKIFWKDENITKLNLINYYRSISKFILPYLKNRPLSLNRHPNGFDGKSFYQKDMDTKQIPDFVKTVKLYSKSTKKYIDYFICNNEASLIYLIQMGSIEINAWNSIYTKPNNPSYLVLDLDPGEISFTAVVDVALSIKEICDKAGIPCFCKTSGSTGLHVYIPLGGKYDDPDIKIFAELLAVMTHSVLPDTTSIERAIAKRKDKVYIDFLQNRKGQTLAAPYCVRPRPGATVSTPLLWKEVNHKLSPEKFTIFNMEERLKKVGDLWEGVLGKGINLKSVLSKLT